MPLGDFFIGYFSGLEVGAGMGDQLSTIDLLLPPGNGFLHESTSWCLLFPYFVIFIEIRSSLPVYGGAEGEFSLSWWFAVPNGALKLGFDGVLRHTFFKGSGIAVGIPCVKLEFP